MRRVLLDPEPVPTKQTEETGGYRRGAKGLFAKGNKGSPGRKLGALNLINKDLGELVLQAADEVGEDGKGKNKRLGYLVKLAKEHPPVFAQLLSKMIVQRVEAKVDTKEEVVFQTVAEVQEEMRRRGLPIIPSLFLDEMFAPDSDSPDTISSRSGDRPDAVPGPVPPLNKLN